MPASKKKESPQKSVVVVESPAKAQTINKYLGNQYTVLASYGHIRDLPSKNGSVDPDNNFAMTWDMDKRSSGHVNDIQKALKDADTLILATDPDREGEAISWHVYNVLNEKGKLKNKTVQRVVFNEITKTAILNAMDNPRQVDDNLVEAYLARRAMDYLVGFTLSPVLWRKLPGSRSAGRVQSVALRLICERESEIEMFDPQEYWSVEADLLTDKKEKVTARLTELFGTKIDKLTLGDQGAAEQAVEAIEQGSFSVSNIENKTVKRNPQPPFITSTLQQDASRKLGFSATRTMQTAQRLYEGISLDGETTGLITYMRTDGVTLSKEAVFSVRNLIEKEFGKPYLPDSPRMYKSKAKNAQEAHEAIRPTDIRRHPAMLKAYLNDDQYRLYELIWKRTLACQMESAVLDQMRVDITSTHDAKGPVTLRANGSVIKFDGFYCLYRNTNNTSTNTDADGNKTALSDDDGAQLPLMHQGDALKQDDVRSEQHFTKPPPRFTEASMVKTLEELGIGRPSTYASIIRVLQDRNYVRMESRRFIPEDRGRLVTAFLTEYFKQYVEYDFTAKLEEQLDEISADQLDWQKVLTQFWAPFKEATEEAQELTITQVLDHLDMALDKHFFSPTEETPNPRECPSCKERGAEDGRLGLKLGKFGAFIGCVNYPECKVTKRLKSDDEGAEAMLADGPKVLGEDPETEKPVYLCKGPYGFYVQLGDEEVIEPPAEEEPKKKTTKATKGKKATKPKKPKVKKPKRAGLPKGKSPMEFTLDEALGLLQLPRELGVHPETGDEISAGLGRFGPFVKQGDLFVSLKGDDDVLTITLERAIEVVVASGKRIIKLGEHNKKPVSIQKGRFGYYIKYNRDNITLPKGTDPDEVTLEEAIERIEAKKAKDKDGKSKGKKTTTKAKKAPAKKKAATTKKKTSAAKKTTKAKTKTAKTKTAVIIDETGVY